MVGSDFKEVCSYQNFILQIQKTYIFLLEYCMFSFHAIDDVTRNGYGVVMHVLVISFNIFSLRRV